MFCVTYKFSLPSSSLSTKTFFCHPTCPQYPITVLLICARPVFPVIDARTQARDGGPGAVS